MTWAEFVAHVDSELTRQGVTRNIEIQWIDTGCYGASTIYVTVSNDKDTVTIS